MSDRDELGADLELPEIFDRLKAEDRGATPSFQSVLRPVRAQASGPEPERGRSWPLRKALPAGAVLAAAGLAAIALFGSPSPEETEFRQAVAWLDSDPLFGSLGAPSDVLLETPGRYLLKSTGPSRGGFSERLSAPAAQALGLTNQRNES